MSAKQKRCRDPVSYYQSPTASPPNKKRKHRLPVRSHHPSQSSVAVPIAVKKAVKNSQGNRCWLCNQKEHKKDRPLEIAHVLPQAMSKRPYFESHHKSGRTQLNNIHDTANLIALCKICHFAFDIDEWTFLPQDMASWIRSVKADPKKDFVRECNMKRNIVFQRFRLVGEPDSEASCDEHFRSSFTNEPLKMWPGEAGAVILRNTSILTNPKDDLDEVIEEFDALRKIWMKYKNPCSSQACPICKTGRDGKESGRDNLDQDEDGDDGNGGNEKRRRISPRKRLDGTRNSSKTSHKSHRYETCQSSTHANRSMRATTHDHSRAQKPRHVSRKTNKSSNHKKSALYDKSVPYSHREGYTWANTTANELMAIWQGLPYIKQANGQITITRVL